MRVQRTFGFTLIELLVVITITGILATVVLASLNSARTKAHDTAIKAEMDELRSIASMYHLEYGRYSEIDLQGADSIGECKGHPVAMGFSMFGDAHDQTVIDMVRKITDRTDTIAARVRCAAGINTWAFAVPLNEPESGTTGWCIDTTRAKPVNINFNAAGTELESGTEARCP